MATSLAATTARRAATLARLSPSTSPATRAAFLIRRRGLSGAAEHHAPPSSTDASSIELKYVIACSAVSFALGFKCFEKFKKIKEEKVAARAK